MSNVSCYVRNCLYRVHNYIMVKTHNPGLSSNMIKFGFILSVLVMLLQQQIIFNPTISLQRGYYFTYPAYNLNIHDLVLFCVSDQQHLAVMHRLGLPYTKDSCPLSTPYLIKQIVAINNDLVEVSESGVAVNGYLYPNSKSLSHYKQIQLLPLSNGEYKLKAGEYFVLGQTVHSYDSRYFGVIKSDQIYRMAHLIFISNKLIW